MMKHLFKFTHIVAVAFAAVSMLGFTACNDEPNQDPVERATRLEQEIQEKTDSLQTQVDDLQAQVNALIAAGQCDCDFNKVINLVNDSLQNYWNITQVQNFVNGQIKDWVLVSTYQAMVDSLRGALSDINDSIAAHRTDIGQLYADVATLNNAVTAAQATADAAKGLAERDSARIDGVTNRVDTLVTNIYNTVSGLAGRVTTLEGQISQVIDSAAKANALARMDSVRIDALYTMYNQLHETDSVQQRQIDSIVTVIDSLATKAEVRAVKAHADSLYNKALHYSDSLHTIVMDTLSTFDARITTLETILPIVRDSVKLLNDSLVALQAEVATVKAQVEENTRKIDKLTAVVNDVFSKMISGVIIQGTYNPVFGYLALPFGIQSNVLMAYYGRNDHETYFPTVSTSDVVYKQYKLTDDDAAMLGGTVDSWSIPGQTTFLGEGANAGKLFFTVNPNTADLSNATFTLVNSIEQEAGIKLDTIKPSTEKLTFGYTGPTSKAPVAGQSSNGFYEAAAILEESGIETAKIQIDESLKQAVKDFYHNHIEGKSARDAASSLSPTSFTGLAQGLYSQFNGLMPAYAVKASWTDSLGAHNVYSNYALAATAVKPLSYEFFYDRSLRKLPNISPLSDLDLNIDMSDIHFNVNFNIDYANAHITLDPITIDLDEVALYAVASVPNLDTYKITGNLDDIVNVNETIYVELDSLEDYLNKRFLEVTGKWNDSINQAIDEQVNALIDQINTQVHDFAADIEGQLNTQIQAVVDDAKDQVMSKFGKYVDKINKLISKVNGVINRINRFLDNPNKFLQTILVYEGKDRQFHIMSTSKSVPSVFNGSGAIMLYPTSYNAEIAAPAYKKFIAVTNVYLNSDRHQTAQKGNTACTAALNAANSQANFNEVIDGGRFGVAFVGQAGYTYEIFYAALDYHGKISQRKYYVKVK